MRCCCHLSVEARNCTVHFRKICCFDVANTLIADFRFDLRIPCCGGYDSPAGSHRCNSFVCYDCGNFSDCTVYFGTHYRLCYFCFFGVVLCPRVLISCLRVFLLCFGVVVSCFATFMRIVNFQDCTVHRIFVTSLCLPENCTVCTLCFCVNSLFVCDSTTCWLHFEPFCSLFCLFDSAVLIHIFLRSNYVR